VLRWDKHVSYSITIAKAKPPSGSYPLPSDVRAGVHYDTNLVGTLVVSTASAESGFDLGGYGDTYGSNTAVASGAYTTTMNGLIKPDYATVGWGGLENANLDTIETLIGRIVALEAA
jgi:hypothetical protein